MDRILRSPFLDVDLTPLWQLNVERWVSAGIQHSDHPTASTNANHHAMFTALAYIMPAFHLLSCPKGVYHCVQRRNSLVESQWLMLVPKNDEAPLHPSTLSVHSFSFNLVVNSHLPTSSFWLCISNSDKHAVSYPFTTYDYPTSETAAFVDG